MERIRRIVQESADKIKQILLEEAERFDIFPKMFFGIRDKKYADTEPCIAEGLLSSVDVRSRGIVVQKPGIIVYNKDDFWTKNHFIIMLPDGLYRFGESMFITTRDGKPTNCLDGYPDLESRKEDPKNYIVHGEQALCEMRQVLKR